MFEDDELYDLAEGPASMTRGACPPGEWEEMDLNQWPTRLYGLQRDIDDGQDALKRERRRARVEEAIASLAESERLREQSRERSSVRNKGKYRGQPTRRDQD